MTSTREKTQLGDAAVAAAAQGKSNSRRAHYEALYPPIGVFETIEDDGARLRMHLVDEGPAETDAIVLIHGASGNVRDFTFDFTRALRAHPAGEGRRIIAIDRPGLGYSDRGPGAAHHPSVQARRMRQAVAQRGVTRALLLGHSLGCASALAWLLDAPDTAIGLVDVAGVTHPWRGTAGYSYDVLSTPVVGGLVARAASLMLPEERAKRDVAGIFAPQDAPAGYADYVGVGLALRASTVRANGLDVGLLKPLIRNQAAQYGAITAPVEIVHGSADVTVPPSIHAEPLEQACPTARMRLLHGIGHMPQHAAPKEVLDAIYAIWRRANFV